jgi:hypothetical protein
MNAPLGHALQLVQHEPVNEPISTDRIEAALQALVEEKRAKTDPTAADQDDCATLSKATAGSASG